MNNHTLLAFLFLILFCLFLISSLNKRNKEFIEYENFINIYDSPEYSMVDPNVDSQINDVSVENPENIPVYNHLDRDYIINNPPNIPQPYPIPNSNNISEPKAQYPTAWCKVHFDSKTGKVKGLSKCKPPENLH